MARQTDVEQSPIFQRLTKKTPRMNRALGSAVSRNVGPALTGKISEVSKVVEQGATPADRRYRFLREKLSNPSFLPNPTKSVNAFGGLAPYLKKNGRYGGGISPKSAAISGAQPATASKNGFG
jgi:hypothetical protein